jgi:YidC/Oxa1 family membrane protein insertase
VNGDYADAITAYQAFGERFRQHELAAQAYYRAAVLTETKLHDEKRAAKYYAKDLWGTYVQLNAKTPRTYYVWRPNEEGTEYERVPVKQAIGKHMDELNSKSQLYQVMRLFVEICGGRAWAGLLLLAVVTRLALYPLTKKQMVSAKRMQELQPELKALQEKYKDDRQLLTRKMMAFYKERGVSPWGGCLPLLLQMPILIALYNGVRLYIYQFSLQGFLWVRDLSDPDLFLLILYTISMVVFQKMTTKATPATDPQQEQMQKTMAYMMPVLFFFMFKNLPAAFILYWLGTNIIYSAQQFYINRLTPATEKADRVVTMATPRPSKANPGPAEEDGEDQAEEPETAAAPAEQLKKRRRRRRRRKPGTAVEQRPEPVAQSEEEE